MAVLLTHFQSKTIRSKPQQLSTVVSGTISLLFRADRLYTNRRKWEHAVASLWRLSKI